MGAEVEVGAIGDTLKLLDAVRETVHDVDGGLGVVRQFVLGHAQEFEVVAIDALVLPPGEAFVHPLVVPVVVGTGFDEELKLHLFEFPNPEDEIAGRDLVAERLADLGDPEG